MNKGEKKMMTFGNTALDVRRIVAAIYEEGENGDNPVYKITFNSGRVIHLKRKVHPESFDSFQVYLKTEHFVFEEVV